MFNNSAVKQEVHELMSTRPGWTFQNAWAYLQQHRPDLFDGAPGAGADAGALLKHNWQTRAYADALIKFSRRSDLMKSPEATKLIQRIESEYGPLPEGVQLVQAVTTPLRHTRNQS